MKEAVVQGANHKTKTVSKGTTTGTTMGTTMRSGTGTGMETGTEMGTETATETATMTFVVQVHPTCASQVYVGYVHSCCENVGGNGGKEYWGQLNRA